jgi:voltage-gated potassium channel Kch
MSSQEAGPWDVGTDEDMKDSKNESISPDSNTAGTIYEWFPLDPDTKGKQVWDSFCMILLVYCSFSVPYNIAFVQSDSSDGFTAVDYSDLAINIIFMIDIALTFITQFENQGIMEKKLPKIAGNYLSTWFLPDIAGSFPFDVVITAAVGSGGNLSSMKLIRMVRLVRAFKFLNKLNNLKEKEGMEAFGPIIGISSAVFILLFSAHFIGCFFTMLATSEPADTTWFTRYDAALGSPGLATADNLTRYGVAIYWAVISLTTMGYGDVIPVTHAERLFCVGVALAGAVIFAHCIGTISSLISQVILYCIILYCVTSRTLLSRSHLHLHRQIQGEPAPLSGKGVGGEGAFNPHSQATLRRVSLCERETDRERYNGERAFNPHVLCAPRVRCRCVYMCVLV